MVFILLKLLLSICGWRPVLKASLHHGLFVGCLAPCHLFDIRNALIHIVALAALINVASPAIAVELVGSGPRLVELRHWNASVWRHHGGDGLSRFAGMVCCRVIFAPQSILMIVRFLGCTMASMRVLLCSFVFQHFKVHISIFLACSCCPRNGFGFLAARGLACRRTYCL